MASVEEQVEDFFKKQLSLFLLPIAMRKHKKLYSGMLKDIQNGKKCEIPWYNLG